MRDISLPQLLGALAVVALVTALVGGSRTVKAHQEPSEVPAVIEVQVQSFDRRIEAHRPELLMLGNSVMEAAIDPVKLEKLTGMRCLDLIIHGSASAIWYAGIKHVLQAREGRPRYLVLLFRDIVLTYPTYRTDSRYHSWLHALAPGDRLLDELVFDPPVDLVSDLMQDHWALYRDRTELREGVERLARERLLDVLFDLDAAQIDEAVSKTFDPKNLVQELATQEEEDAAIADPHLPFFDFDANVERSFLPAMVELTRKAGVELVLVRMRTRRDLPPDEAPAVPEHFRTLLPAYVGRLASYLEERGVTFVDMADEEEIRLEHFAVGDHLTAEVGQSLFTRLLAKRLGEVGVVAGERGARR